MESTPKSKSKITKFSDVQPDIDYDIPRETDPVNSSLLQHLDLASIAVANNDDINNNNDTFDSSANVIILCHKKI